LAAACAMFGHRFHRFVFVGATSNALLIRKHEPLMMDNFRDDVGWVTSRHLRGFGCRDHKRKPLPMESAGVSKRGG
jgi:hypothetical protein